ncbi:hypothetical protein JDV02_009228 [Purpureocillium takamizusanense]|uniref:Protein phosphatase 4 core regulatory subunit R2 n=1 Tax=Purpureocillium takamizusanense TaxID=2060973 RepID=A0A9Q8QPI6_9HYPO|nr:uncharacterized protein JDV02_009228 [Purpureocillium takamizusanense]UNI23408.1 hypothetical protein JDV02_009228 [Purpureocillium takamizusanense]
MEVDSDNEALGKIACGAPVQEGSWPTLRTEILSRLEKIAHNDFAIPTLPHLPARRRLLSPLPSSPLEQSSSQEANKENEPADGRASDVPDAPAPKSPAPGELPAQIADLLAGIKSHLETFTTYAPHTIQRLAELVTSPRAHYKALASYLHAVDRVVQVTSGTNIFPLPPAVPDMSAMGGATGLSNGEEGSGARDPAATVAWSNPTTAPLGSDEALGGALLTPIPWLTRRSPESSNGDTTPGGGAQIHSEGTETIDGPNGMGSIETVSVSVNGVPSTGHARGVTQGELLRQEQRAGVVPVSQLSRSPGPISSHHDAPGEEGRNKDGDGTAGAAASEVDEEEEEVPHARGPEEIGVGDTGPQAPTTSHMGEDGVEMKGIDVAAALGRRQEDDAVAHPSAADADADADTDVDVDADATDAAEDTDMPSPNADSTGTKREAEQPLDGEPPKKLKESGADDVDDAADLGASESEAAAAATIGQDGAPKAAPDQADAGDGEKMEET